MNKFISRHWRQFERLSSISLAMALGYWLFLQMGDYASAVAVAVIFVSSLFRVYLFARAGGCNSGI